MYSRLHQRVLRRARSGGYCAVLAIAVLSLLLTNLTASAQSQENPDTGAAANSIFLPVIQNTNSAVVEQVAVESVVTADHIPGGHLVAVGPVSGDTGFPVWYQDGNGLRLELCLNSETSPLAYCGFLPGDIPDPNSPLTMPGNFPEEAFWMLGGAGLTTNAGTGGDAVLTLALEAAFGGGAAKVGDQVAFGRVRVVADDLIPGATYIVTHPYGQEVFSDVARGKRGIVFTEDIGIGAPGDFSGALNSRVGPFLSWSDFPNSPDLPNLPNGQDAFVGDPALDRPIKGSPFGTNFFRIEGPAGSFVGSTDLCANPTLGNDPVATDDCIETSLFSLMGKVATNSGVSANRATYTRSNAGGGSINVWASSIADQAINLVRSAGYPTIAFDGNGRGRYYARVDFAGDPPLQATVRNASDVPVTDKTIAVVDKVTITRAEYDADSDTLTIAAESSDTYLDPTLTAFADGVFVGVLSSGSLVVPAVGIAPELTMVSSAAGGSDTEAVEVAGAGFVAAPVVAAITVPDGEAVAPVTPSPDPDGTITVFTIQPYGVGASVVSLDGVLQAAGTDYVELDAVAGTIQFAVAPPVGSTISTPPPLTFNVVQGQVVTLSGGSSSGDIDSFGWTQIGGDVAMALAGASTSVASFTAPAQETSMTFQLVVTRNTPPTANSQTVVINVVGGQPAVANAGPDQTVAPGSLVQLDGRGSARAVSYAWTQLPGGTVATLTGAATATPTFTFPAGSGPLTFRLTVTGSDGGTSIDDVVISAISDNLAVARAEYRQSKRQWRIDGTALLLGGNTVTIYLGPDFSGQVLGTAQVDTTGAWAFTQANSAIGPGAVRTVSVRSSRGGTVTGFPLTVRR